MKNHENKGNFGEGTFEVFEGGKGKTEKKPAETNSCEVDGMREYMKAVGSVPLLTEEEEQELGRRIAVGIEAEARLSDEEADVLLGLREREELNRMVRDGEAAQTYLTVANLRLSFRVAKKFRGRGLEFEDVIQHANIGLMKAARRFDYKKGNRFSTYATWRIQAEIQSGLTNTAHMIRVPAYMRKNIDKMNRVTSQLQEELGRDPSAAEIAKVLHTEPEEVESLLRYNQVPDSLDREVGEDGTSKLWEIIADEQDRDPADVAVDRDLIRILYEKLGMLEEREQFVLRMRFGLDGGEEQTLAAVGKQLGVSRECVRRIQIDALCELRRLFSDEKER